MLGRLWRSYGWLAQVGLAMGALTVCVLFARYVLGTWFSSYDDEGFFLLARQWRFDPFKGPAATFSPYGPFYWFAQEVLLGAPGTHDAGRAATMWCWLGAGGLGGVFVWRVSRNLLLAAAAALACVRVLSVLGQESGHPQQEVAFLLALGCVLSASVKVAGRARWVLYAMGGVGAALALTKINVGAFYFVALAHALACVVWRGRWRTAANGVLLAFALLAPPLLARAHLRDGAAGFAVVASLCMAATFASGSAARVGTGWNRAAAWGAVLGASVVAVLLVGMVAILGVAPWKLFEATVLDPARNPSGGLFLGFRLGWLPCVATVMMLSAVSWVRWRGERLAEYGVARGWLRCGAGVAVIFLLVRTDLTWVMPLLPLGVMPLAVRKWETSEWFTRLFVADLAAAQFLQTYPVAGGQAGIAAVPVMLWAFVCVTDGLEEMGRARQAVWVGVLVAVVVAAGMWVSGLRSLGFAYPASKLPGAQSLHLEPGQEATFRFLSDAIRKNCSVLYTLPRMHSLSLWSNVPAVRGSEWPLSFQMYSAERQRLVLAELQGDTSACAVYNREILDFWQAPAPVIAGSPLAQWVIREMPVVAERGGYEIRVHPRRAGAWIE